MEVSVDDEPWVWGCVGGYYYGRKVLQSSSPHIINNNCKDVV